MDDAVTLPPIYFNYSNNVDNASTNGSVSPDYAAFFMWADKPFVPPLLTFLWTTLMIIGVTGNLGFIYVRSRVPYMRTLTNYYLVNLGIADTIFLLALVPGEVWNLYREAANGLWHIKSYCIVMNITMYPCQFTSLFTLTVIACERYMAICHPFKMSGVHNTKSRAFKFIILTWVLGVLASVPLFLSCNDADNTDLLTSLFAVRLITFVPCMIIIAVLYILIGKQLGRRIHKPGGKEEQVRRERKQVIRMLVVTAGVFFLCTVPQQVYALYTTCNVLGMAPIVPFNVGRVFFSVNKTLVYANSAANPVIYNVMSSKYRVAFKEAFGPLCLCVKMQPKQKYYYDNSNHTIVTM